MAMSGILANAQVIASKTAILTLSPNHGLNIKHNVSFTNTCKSNTLEETHRMSTNLRIPGNTANIINLKCMQISPKRCVSSALLSTWTLPLSNRPLNLKTTPSNLFLVNDNARFFSVNSNRRAEVIDGRFREDKQDPNEGKLITKVENIEEEEIHDQSTTKSDITYKPLNMRAIEEISEKVEKFAAVYLTQQQREEFLKIFKSNLVVVAMRKRAELRRELIDRQKFLTSKLVEEREHGVESPTLSQKNDLEYDSTDFRLSNIVIPDIMSTKIDQENVEAQDILNDNFVKMTVYHHHHHHFSPHNDENPTNDNTATTKSSD